MNQHQQHRAREHRRCKRNQGEQARANFRASQMNESVHVLRRLSGCG
jgi:hypothetical protein